MVVMNTSPVAHYDTLNSHVIGDYIGSARFGAVCDDEDTRNLIVSVMSLDASPDSDEYGAVQTVATPQAVRVFLMTAILWDSLGPDAHSPLAIAARNAYDACFDECKTDHWLNTFHRTNAYNRLVAFIKGLIAPFVADWEAQGRPLNHPKMCFE